MLDKQQKIRKTQSCPAGVYASREYRQVKDQVISALGRTVQVAMCTWVPDTGVSYPTLDTGGRGGGQGRVNIVETGRRWGLEGM